MNAPWPRDELDRIGQTDDLHMSTLREDGLTHGTPTWIWCVIVDGAVYVRAYNGQASRCYQVALPEKTGGITAAVMTKDFVFEPFRAPSNDRINDAHTAKYSGGGYLDQMIRDRACSATIKLSFRETG